MTRSTRPFFVGALLTAAVSAVAPIAGQKSTQAEGKAAGSAVAPITGREALPAQGSEGSFPGSFLIPGTDLSFKVGGRIKLDVIQDFDAITNPDVFKTSSIPVPEVASDGNSNLQARDSRLHVEVRSPSPVRGIRPAR